MQNVVLLIDPLVQASDVSSKAGNMYLNRFCIDEEAAFESTGVYSSQTYREKRFSEVMQRVTASKSNDLTIHFICTLNGTCFTDDWLNQLRSFLLREIEKHGIKTVMVTILHIRRYNLITKESRESFYQGKKLRKESVNDDLESLFDKLRLGEKPYEDVRTYFLPKLTEEELKLVENKDFDYFQTFDWSNPDVDEAFMKSSESESKFVQGFCWRTTFTIENEKVEKNKVGYAFPMVISSDIRMRQYRDDDHHDTKKFTHGKSNHFSDDCCSILKRLFNK